MKKLFAALFLIAALAVSASAAPVTVTDLAGRTVTVGAPVKRAVLTFYFEEFIAVTGEEGLGQIAGWSRQYWVGRRQSTWDAFAAKFPEIDSIPDVGYINRNTFNLEAVLALNPDVVIFSKNDLAKIPHELARLEAAGIPAVILDYHDQTVENHAASTRLLGVLTGHEARANELAGWYAEKVSAVWDKAASLGESQRPRVYMEWSGTPDGPANMGITWGKGMWGSIIERCGGTNIARDLVPGVEGTISAEMVLAADPQVILLSGSYIGPDAKNVGLGYEADEASVKSRIETYMSRPGWSGLDAVKGRRMGGIYHDLSRHIFDAAGIEFIAKLLHSELFSGLDPQATLQEFYDRFFPVPLTGCFMAALDE